MPPRCYSNSPSDYIEFCLFQNGFQYQKLELSNVLELGSDFDVLYGLYRSSARQATRKAKRSGVTIQQSDQLETFYEILTNNLSLRHNVAPTHTLSELKKT